MLALLATDQMAARVAVAITAALGEPEIRHQPALHRVATAPVGLLLLRAMAAEAEAVSLRRVARVHQPTAALVVRGLRHLFQGRLSLMPAVVAGDAMLPERQERQQMAAAREKRTVRREIMEPPILAGAAAAQHPI